MESWNSVSFYSSVLCHNTDNWYMIIGIKHGSLETSVNVGFPSVYCSSTVFVCGFFVCYSALTTVVWTRDMAASSLCVSLKGVTCFDPSWHCLKWVNVCVFCRRCISEFSPAL